VSYTTIQYPAIFEYEDRKSVFIGESMPISTEQDALDFISQIKKKYPDAKHHVYAYILRENSIMRFSDDREPQGTAGMPVLDAIRKNGCTDIVIVVTRYFGGTLLGTGGLVRAYSTAALGALKKGNIITYDLYSEIKITCSYSDYQRVLPYLEEIGFYIDDTDFSDSVTLLGKIIQTQLEELTRNLIEITSARCEIQHLGEKFDFIQKD